MAAYELRRLVLQQCGQLAASIDVQARIVANLNGLARSMVRDNIIWKPEDLRDFFLGFTQASPSFDFVDVGDSKDCVASKIKENARWHLQNSNCKQILLGISHDSAYAPFLTEILRDELTRRQVTVFEGVPTAKELAATGVNVFSEDKDLFRTEKLSAHALDQCVSTFSRSMSLELSAPSSITGSPQATSTTTVPTPPPLGNNSPCATWADMALKTKPASPPPVISLPLANRTNIKNSVNSRTKLAREVAPPPSILDDWKPGERGLDDLIIPNPTVLEEIKKRRENQKICNNHFLRGPCTKAGCAFVHDYNPTDDELTVIAYLARLNPCTRGQNCDNYECIYGHHVSSTTICRGKRPFLTRCSARASRVIRVFTHIASSHRMHIRPGQSTRTPTSTRTISNISLSLGRSRAST